jgi:hypothetical protein
LVAAVVIVAVAAAANWQGIVITFLGLLLIVVAGWYVVSRRGVARSVAALTGLAGVALLIAGFIVAELSLLTWVTVAVLAVVSVVAARVALRQSAMAMYERAGSRSPVPPARGQGEWRADEGLRVHDGPEVVEPGGQRRIRSQVGDHPVFVRVTEQGPEVGPLVRGQPLLGHIRELEEQHEPRLLQLIEIRLTRAAPERGRMPDRQDQALA